MYSWTYRFSLPVPLDSRTRISMPCCVYDGRLLWSWHFRAYLSWAVKGSKPRASEVWLTSAAVQSWADIQKWNGALKRAHTDFTACSFWQQDSNNTRISMHLTVKRNRQWKSVCPSLHMYVNLTSSEDHKGGGYHFTEVCHGTLITEHTREVAWNPSRWPAWVAQTTEHYHITLGLPLLRSIIISH